MRSILTVTAEAAADRLTTYDRMKLELGLQTDTDQLLIEAKIDDATSDIVDRVVVSCKRESLSETFRHEPGDAYVDSLPLRRRPVASIASVTCDDVALTTAQYELDVDTGLLFRLDDSGRPTSWSFNTGIVVAYTAGFLLPGEDGRDLPGSIEAAAIELVTSYWRSRGRDPLLKSEENVGVTRFDYWVGAIGAAGDLPPGVMAKLAPYMAGRTG